MRPLFRTIVPSLAVLLFIPLASGGSTPHDIPAAHTPALPADNPVVLHKTPAEDPAKNSLVWIISPLSYTQNFEKNLFTYGLEYTRQLKRRWRWGISLTSSWTFPYTGGCYDAGPGSHYYAEDRSITRLMANFYYQLPLVRHWMSLRFGAGIGIGMHRQYTRDYYSATTYRFAPYMSSDMVVIFSPGRRFQIELCAVPFPSWIAWALVDTGDYYGGLACQFDMAFTVRIGWRF